MNNWLAFSLSSQELPTAQPYQGHAPPAAVSRIISGDNVSTDCYGISANASSDPPLGIPTLRPDGSFGILEALNRTHHQPHEWGMQGLEFKGNTTDLSMVVGSSSNQTDMDEDEPRLEDFLRGHSLSDHDQKIPPGSSSIPGDYMYSNCTLQLPATASVASNGGRGVLVNTGGSSGIGLSMIKTWLRSQPTPSQQLEMNSNDLAGTSSGGDCGSASVVGNSVSLANSQALSLSMGTGSQSNSALPLMAAVGSGRGESTSIDNKQKGSASALDSQTGAKEAVTRKSNDTFGQRTSIYRGVTRHRWTGRYEAHLWDNSCRREGQTRKGRQVYLGGYDKEEKAARAYDLAALKYWGTTTTTNFPIRNYEKELEEMKHMTRQEYVASLRRKSSGFSRGASVYRGVTRHHQHGRWQARIGRVAGNKDLYLGTFSTQEEAAEAYDIAAIKFRGLNAVTNFDMSRYDVKSILESGTLPIGGAAKRLKEVSEQVGSSIDGRRTDDDAFAPQLTDGLSSYALHHHGWSTIAFQQNHPLGLHYPYGQQRDWCKPEDGIPVAQSLQDLQQVHLGSSMHNFFQPSPANNLMSLDSSSMEHSTGSNSVVYKGSMGTNSGGYQGYMSGNSGYVMPLSTVVVDQSHNNQGNSSYGDSEGKQLVYENMLANTDPYSARNLYYRSQQSSGSVVKENEYEQSCCWVPASAQATASRPGKMAGSHGAPIFSVWNDA